MKRAGWQMLIAILVAAGGCNRQQFLAQATPTAPGGTLPPQVAQLDEFRRRAEELDVNNRDLHTQLAQSRQLLQVSREQLLVLQKQLNEAGNQLQEMRLAKQETEKKVEGLLASTNRRGGATLTANNSLKQKLQVVSLPGFDVRSDEDVIRIEVPAEQLFQPGSSQFTPTAASILDNLASSISATYPKQMVGVEGHSEPTANPTVSSHQLAGAQALAVCEQLTQRGRLPSRQVFAVSHGANVPRVSNATPQGRTKNRRIELVIYPESPE